jgi:peroxiredoxin Q/BCP
MKQLIHILSIAAVVTASSIAVSAQQPVAGQPELKIGDRAPDFTLQASDGQTYSLAKLKGKFVVLAWFPKAFTAG